MKLRIAALAALALALFLVPTACGGKDDEGSKKKETKPAAEKAQPAAQPVEAEASYKFKDGSDNEIAKVKKISDQRWTVAMGGRKYALEKNDKYEFKLPDGKKLKARLDEDKIKLKDGEDVRMEIKFYDDKIKIETPGLENYEFKNKEDKIKVFRGDVELGSVRYYSDTGKLKVKGLGDAEVAVSKDVARTTYAACPFLMGSEVPEEHRAFVLLLLFQMNK